MNNLKDELHRGSKILMDAGEARSPEDALRLLRSYRFTCVVGPEIASSPTLQAALLTAVNTGHRSCLGGVQVVGISPEVPLLLPGMGGRTLMEALTRFGGVIDAGAVSVRSGTPIVVFGTPDTSLTFDDAPVTRVTFNGWCAAVAPVEGGFRLDERHEFTLAGVMAGALAVSECFQHLRGSNVMAMRRRVGLSLWRPDAGSDGDDAWIAETGPEMGGALLPKDLWLLGLGHLGQAYLWCLMLLPYADSGQVRLVLQDYDRLTASGVSTGMLTDRVSVGKMKTRHLAEVAESRGFNTAIVERPFSLRLRIDLDDPQMLLCGVDNLRTRGFLENRGFKEIIEAGLGHTAAEYQAIRLHTFPASRTAEEVFREYGTAIYDERLLGLPAYQAIRQDAEDECGVVQVAQASVGVPFVGATAAAFAIAEAVRAVMGGPRYEVVDTSLGTPTFRSVATRPDSVPSGSIAFTPST